MSTIQTIRAHAHIALAKYRAGSVELYSVAMAMENFTIGLLMDMLITLIRVRTQANRADAQHK